MTPLVSILIPAYNAECWIAETMRSTLGQTRPKHAPQGRDDSIYGRLLTRTSMRYNNGDNI
jgi:glycosyltransferase involved in cell wall biosynthesis